MGRNLATVTDLFRALRVHREAGFVTGYNMLADGWGMLAWPIPITLNPRRVGAVSIGAPVETLRRHETVLVRLASSERNKYLNALRGATISG